ncbi:MAG: DUF370 domain-containing protein [Clostridia bacterium]|nr:DUF370 domain-containing protein [Clostridia bacterium]
MYLRLSNDCVIPKNEIIGIFDMDNTTVSRQGREFLPRAERDGQIVYTSSELPKSYVVTEAAGRKRVYLSPLSSKILTARVKTAALL